MVKIGYFAKNAKIADFHHFSHFFPILGCPRDPFSGQSTPKTHFRGVSDPEVTQKYEKMAKLIFMTEFRQGVRPPRGQGQVLQQKPCIAYV